MYISAFFPHPPTLSPKRPCRPAASELINPPLSPLIRTWRPAAARGRRRRARPGPAPVPGSAAPEYMYVKRNGGEWDKTMDRTIDRIGRCIPITVGVGCWIRSTTRAARSIHPPIHCTAPVVSTHPLHCAAAVVSSCPPTHSLTHSPPLWRPGQERGRCR